MGLDGVLDPLLVEEENKSDVGDSLNRGKKFLGIRKGGERKVRGLVQGWTRECVVESW